MLQPALISVPSPCPALWEQMTPVGGGRHCASCQKRVQDFSTFSDRELANWLATYTGSAACGRFRADQLDRPVYQVRSGQPGQGVWVRWVVALVLGWQTTKGQHRQPMADFSIPLVPAIETALNNSSTIATETDTNQLVTYTISGRVIDEDKLPVAGCNVVIKGTTHGINADREGNFKLLLTQKDGFASTVLLFSFIGYKHQEITVTSDRRDPLLITMQASDELLGEVIVTYPRGNFLQRIFLAPKKLLIRQK